MYAKKKNKNPAKPSLGAQRSGRPGRAPGLTPALGAASCVSRQRNQLPSITFYDLDLALPPYSIRGPLWPRDCPPLTPSSCWVPSQLGPTSTACPHAEGPAVTALRTVNTFRPCGPGGRCLGVFPCPPDRQAFALWVLRQPQGLGSSSCQLVLGASWGCSPGLFPPSGFLDSLGACLSTLLIRRDRSSRPQAPRGALQVRAHCVRRGQLPARPRASCRLAGGPCE